MELEGANFIMSLNKRLGEVSIQEYYGEKIRVGLSLMEIEMVALEKLGMLGDGMVVVTNKEGEILKD